MSFLRCPFREYKNKNLVSRHGPLYRFMDLFLGITSQFITSVSSTFTELLWAPAELLVHPTIFYNPHYTPLLQVALSFFTFVHTTLFFFPSPSFSWEVFHEILLFILVFSLVEVHCLWWFIGKWWLWWWLVWPLMTKVSCWFDFFSA